MTHELTLTRPEGTASLTLVRGEWVRLLSSVPSPPGSTLEGVLNESVPPYRVKVKNCRREATSGEFAIEGKLVNLTRAQREALESAG